MIMFMKIRYTQRKSGQQYSYTNNLLPHEIQKEKVLSTIKSLPTLLPIRPYLNYLQFFYHHNHAESSHRTRFGVKEDIIDQYKSLVENNEQLTDYLFKISIQSNNENILNNLILTQRYNLKKLFKYNHPLIDFNICMLTSYDTFLINHIHSLFSQIYSQLKFKIYNGPVDAVEQTLSYYTLNVDTILHEYSIRFKTIQLTVHIDSNNNNNSNELLLNVTCLTCDTISQVKQKILNQLNFKSQISVNDCKLYLLTSPSCSHSSSSSSSSSSSTASSSVPLTRKSLLTKVLYNRTIKYSTTTINDAYRDSYNLLLSDIDNSSEQVDNGKKLNTLQHYGIIADGYELKLILSTKQNNDANSSLNSRMFDFIIKSFENR